MNIPFHRVGICCHLGKSTGVQTLMTLVNFLKEKSLSFVLEEKAQILFSKWDTSVSFANIQSMGEQCDVIVVIGGDGTLLDVAHSIVDHEIPLIGINHGRVGYLTEIQPEQSIEKISQILEGQYLCEDRFLLQAKMEVHHRSIPLGIGLNDLVFCAGNVTQLIEFEIYINQQFLASQRSDGLIISTPTGSTAYAMSGGGPIVHPKMDAIVLVPMFPHTLSSRPIVIDGNSEITLVIPSDLATHPIITCDGLQRLPIAPDGKIIITKYPKKVKLLHPLHYNYFETLRNKLYWGKKLYQDT